MSPLFIGAAIGGARSAYKTSGRQKVYSPPQKHIETTWQVEGHDVCTLQYGLPSAIRQGKIEAGYDKKLLAQQIIKEEINPQKELNSKGNLELGVGTGLFLTTAGLALVCPPAAIIPGVLSLGSIIKGAIDKSKAKEAPRSGYRTSINQQAYINLKKNEQTGKDELLYSRFEVGGKVDNNTHNPTVLAILE